MKLEDLLAEVRELDEKATKGPMEIGIVDRTLDPVEWFRRHLEFGSVDIWAINCPKHPKAVGPDAKPDHAVLSAITGNGPDSEVNAIYFARSRVLLPLLAKIVKVYALHYDTCPLCNQEIEKLLQEASDEQGK